MRLSAARAALALATVLVAALSATQSAQAQTFTVLHSFDGVDGQAPVGALVQAINGNLYGTTEYGNSMGVEEGQGNIYEITPAGAFTSLLNFTGANGAFPYAGLVQATNGNLYGTTYGNGGGTVYQLTLGGTLTTLHTFVGTDGDYPYDALVQAANGDLYGTTYNGGAGYGTVFRITTAGTFASLVSFDFTNGVEVAAGVIQATNGNFYGTTTYGGTNGYGNVYQMTPTGTVTTLHSFDNSDGSNVVAGLVQAPNGKLYGTTTYGGAFSDGVIFDITTTGAFTVLFNFNISNGGFPNTSLILGSDGNLYGTTSAGGPVNTTCPNGCGTIFQITPAGALTTIYFFCRQTGCPDGYAPAGLVQDTSGVFYGATAGGAKGMGGVYSFSTGLPAFIETLLTSGKVGSAVKILGTNLTGATSVEFNGKAAKFTLVSSSEITTTVPSGATTGKVKVTTPRGTVSSIVNFRVTP